jgi:hypothetical protein
MTIRGNGSDTEDGITDVVIDTTIIGSWRGIEAGSLRIELESSTNLLEGVKSGEAYNGGSLGSPVYRISDLKEWIVIIGGRARMRFGHSIISRGEYGFEERVVF